MAILIEQGLWRERVVPNWNCAFAPPNEQPTLAYQFTATNRITLAVVPAQDIFRYDGGVRQSSSAEVRDLESASHLVRLDTGSVPVRLPAVALGIDIFRVLPGHLPHRSDDAILHAIERYWRIVYEAQTSAHINEVFQETRYLLEQLPARLVFP